MLRLDKIQNYWKNNRPRKTSHHLGVAFPSLLLQVGSKLSAPWYLQEKSARWLDGYRLQEYGCDIMGQLWLIRSPAQHYHLWIAWDLRVCFVFVPQITCSEDLCKDESRAVGDQRYRNKRWFRFNWWRFSLEVKWSLIVNPPTWITPKEQSFTTKLQTCRVISLLFLIGWNRLKFSNFPKQPALFLKVKTLIMSSPRCWPYSRFPALKAGGKWLKASLKNPWRTHVTDVLLVYLFCFEYFSFVVVLILGALLECNSFSLSKHHTRYKLVYCIVLRCWSKIYTYILEGTNSHCSPQRFSGSSEVFPWWSSKNWQSLPRRFLLVDEQICID